MQFEIEKRFLTDNVTKHSGDKFYFQVACIVKKDIHNLDIHGAPLVSAQESLVNVEQFTMQIYPVGD